MRKRADTITWQAIKRVKTNAKKRKEYKIKALIAEAKVKNLKMRLAKYEQELK